MTSTSTQADSFKEPKTAHFNEPPVMGYSSDIGRAVVLRSASAAANLPVLPTAGSSSEVPTGTKTSRVKSKTNALGRPTTTSTSGTANTTYTAEMPKTADSIRATNPNTEALSDVSNSDAARKSIDRDSAQSTERISAESAENERIQFLIAHMQWKELCKNFLFPLLALTFVILGLQFLMPFDTTLVGQVWYRYSMFLWLLILLTGFVTEVAYEEFSHS